MTKFVFVSFFFLFYLNFFDAKASVSYKERQAIVNYTTSTFEEINSHLRGLSYNYDLREEIHYLYSGINKIKKTDNSVSYRISDNFPGGMELDDFLDLSLNDKKNTVFKADAFISTSRKKAFLSSNTGIKGSMKFKIYGKSSRDISRYSTRFNERESIFLPGTKFRYLGITDEEIIVLEEI